ncbi:MAG: TadE/TadG family type IV pilus assembly protein [Pseudomonadota bacterium]
MDRNNAVVRELRRSLGAFIRDDSGASALELIVSLPLLVGCMLITANYGLLISTREALDSATRDATRLLTRAPAALNDNGTVDDTSDDLPQLYTFFVDEARQLVADRLGVPLGKVALTTRVDFISGSEALRNRFYLITVSATVTLDDYPLLGWVVDPVFTATESGRWAAESNFGTVGCTISDNQSGLCR